MNLHEQKNTLQDARNKIEALLRHFTRTPSTLADSTARVEAHKALDDIDTVLAAMTVLAPQSGHIATVVAGNLANRLEWSSDAAHETTPVGTKLFDEATVADAFARGRESGLAAAAKGLENEGHEFDR